MDSDMAKLATDRLKQDIETAKYQTLAAKTHHDAALFGFKLGKRPSSYLGPLLIYYDDVGSRWAASYGAIGDKIVAMLPSHITETGVTAYGASPDEAVRNFDRIWLGVDVT